MIIECSNGKQVDTRTLSPAERHVIQKLLAWHSLAESLVFFREKTRAALETGWDGTGPVRMTRALEQVIKTLEADLVKRIS